MAPLPPLFSPHLGVSELSQEFGLGAIEVWIGELQDVEELGLDTPSGQARHSIGQDPPTSFGGWRARVAWVFQASLLDVSYHVIIVGRPRQQDAGLDAERLEHLVRLRGGVAGTVSLVNH